MALRHVTWLATTLTVVTTLLLIHTPTGRTSAPAATDVLFVFDTTGSMSGALSEAQGQAATVMSDLSGRLPNLRFGVAQLRDYGSTPVWRVEQGLSADRASVQAAIDSLSADEGGDSPEAYGTGLFQSRSDPAVGWATGAKHLVVLIADDVPHDDDLNAGVPPEIVNQPVALEHGDGRGPERVRASTGSRSWPTSRPPTTRSPSSSTTEFRRTCPTGTGGRGSREDRRRSRRARRRSATCSSRSSPRRRRPAARTSRTTRRSATRTRHLPSLPSYPRFLAFPIPSTARIRMRPTTEQFRGRVRRPQVRRRIRRTSASLLP